MHRGSGRTSEAGLCGEGATSGAVCVPLVFSSPASATVLGGGLRSAWGHVTHPCQRGLWVWEVTSGQERYGPQTNQLQRAGYQGVLGTLSLFLREPGPLHAILGARKRERKSVFVSCGLLGRLLESGCEGNLCPPHWFCGLSQGFATCHVGARLPSGPRGGHGGPRSRSVALTLPLVN